MGSFAMALTDRLFVPNCNHIVGSTQSKFDPMMYSRVQQQGNEGYLGVVVRVGPSVKQ